MTSGNFTGYHDKQGNMKVRPATGGRTVIVRDPYGFRIDAGEEVRYELTGRGIDFSWDQHAPILNF
ncbi:MAG: hypothetical protein HYY37_06315 [Candidatus Aenigmarchaeota archaeon]|nr:hypothetical protein [Candidatus Aenigmarchaeota archaeon]